MKRYMGHFGESVNPNSILAKINELDVLISENNQNVKLIEDEIELNKEAISEYESQIKNLTPALERLKIIKNFTQARITWNRIMRDLAKKNSSREFVRQTPELMAHKASMPPLP